MISRPMTTSSSVRSAAGPKRYDRIPNRISPTITQANSWVVCATVMTYSPPQSSSASRFTADAFGFWPLRCRERSNRASSARFYQTTRLIRSRTHSNGAVAEHLSRVLRYRCPPWREPPCRTDDRVPAAPAALAGANTGRSPRLKPHRHCRSGSVSQSARRPPRPNERSSRPARADQRRRASSR
jgi:hypothetical protein